LHTVNGNVHRVGERAVCAKPIDAEHDHGAANPAMFV
jgi:hypothetical protein